MRSWLRHCLALGVPTGKRWQQFFRRNFWGGILWNLERYLKEQADA